MAAAAVVLLPVGAPGAAAVVGRPDLLLLALGTALLASVLPYSFELVALRRLPAGVFGVLLSLEPAVATVAGWLLLGQPAGRGDAAGVALVVLASVGSTLSAHRPLRVRRAGRGSRARAEVPTPAT
jgi:inner membrane transporter RhtA